MQGIDIVGFEHSVCLVQSAIKGQLSFIGSSTMTIKGRACVGFVGAALVIGALLGFVITYVSMRHGHELVDKSVRGKSDSLTKEADESISKKLIEEMDAERIREHLR